MNPEISRLALPATNVASCMAVPCNRPGAFPANVAVLAIESFRKDFPLLAARLESMRQRGGGVAGSLRDGSDGAAEGVPEFMTPPSNTGVNKILSLAQGSK